MEYIHQSDRLMHWTIHANLGSGTVKLREHNPNEVVETDRFYYQNLLRIPRRFVSFIHPSSLFTESFCGDESLILHPGIMDHASMTPAAPKEAVSTENLLRMSTGLPDRENFLLDLYRAFS